jgi:hypothetical protein
MRCVGSETCMGERLGVYWLLVGKREGKSPLGRRRRRWENNIKVYLQEIGLFIYVVAQYSER